MIQCFFFIGSQIILTPPRLFNLQEFKTFLLFILTLVTSIISTHSLVILDLRVVRISQTYYSSNWSNRLA